MATVSAVIPASKTRLRPNRRAKVGMANDAAMAMIT
jgi:hypothetical protein